MRWFRLVRDFSPNNWWRKFPYLPVPPKNYLLFRLHTQYGQQWWKYWKRMPHDLVVFVDWREATRLELKAREILYKYK